MDLISKNDAAQICPMVNSKHIPLLPRYKSVSVKNPIKPGTMAALFGATQPIAGSSSPSSALAGNPIVSQTEW